MEKKARLLNMQVNLDEFIPATEEEKEYMVQMRPSTTFFKDGMKRLVKNKVAFISLILIVVITLASVIIPFFWPYKYDTMLGVRPGKPVDSSHNNLAPFEYGETELKKIAAGEKVFPHVFGTDSGGRDYFIRVVYGTRISRRGLLRQHHRADHRHVGRLHRRLLRRYGGPHYHAYRRYDLRFA